MKIQINKILSEDMKAPYYKRVKGIHEKNKKTLIGFGVGADENRGPFKTDRSMSKKGKSAPPGAAGGGSLEEDEKIMDDTNKQEVENMIAEILAEMLGLSEKKDMICDGTMCNEVHDGMSHKEYESYSMQEEEGKDDRCTRIAKRKYDAWPSAYASGAVVRCRRGEIWKGEK